MPCDRNEQGKARMVSSCPQQRCGLDAGSTAPGQRARWTAAAAQPAGSVDRSLTFFEEEPRVPLVKVPPRVELPRHRRHGGGLPAAQDARGGVEAIEEAAGEGLVDAALAERRGHVLQWEHSQAGEILEIELLRNENGG